MTPPPSFAPFLRRDLAALEEYTPVKPLDVLAAEIGVPVADLVKLDANENLYGPPAEVRDAMQDAVLHIYPDPGQQALRTAIGGYCGVDADQVVAGSGADDLIDILIRLVDPTRVVAASPTFGMYSFLAKISKSSLLDVPRQPPAFRIDAAAVADAARKVCAADPGNTAIIMVASPNNPTGDLLTEAEVETLCAAPCLVVVDEAYAEFSQTSYVPFIEKFPNLVILRTFSKWAALAGMRVGYGIAHRDLAARMMAIKQPYNVNVAGDVAAQAAIKHRDLIKPSVDALRNEIATISAKLAEFAFLRPLPTHSNFVLVEVVSLSAEILAAHLRRQGVLVRYYRRNDLTNYIRVSAGRPADTAKLIAALSDFEATWRDRFHSLDALLFDMDGVLADVSGSYRRAIVETAAAYGVTVTQEQIAAAKNAGNANNDWVLTHALVCAAKGPDAATLEQITDTFEQLYNGHGDKPGLYKTETLIPDRAVLERLAKRKPLAIVTGRPRSQCARFLKDFGLEDLFKISSCMEDGIKPDPAPVQVALDHLGAKTALLLGDTPDDIRAAVAAGIQGVGIPAPGHAKNAANTTALYRAGAARVVDSIEELAAVMGC